MPIVDLVAHVRRWVAGPRPNDFYARHLDAVFYMDDAQVADIVRFAKTPRGAERAILGHIRVSLLVAA